MKSKYYTGLFFGLCTKTLSAADTFFVGPRSDTTVFEHTTPLGIYIIQMAIFIVVLIVIGYIVKRYSIKKTIGKDELPFFRLLYTHYLGHSSYIQVYMMFDNIVVLGITKDGLTPILTIDDKERVDEIMLYLSTQIKGKKFKDLLRTKDIYSLIKESVKKGAGSDKESE